MSNKQQKTYPVMLNLLITVPTVIIFILEMSVYIFFSCLLSKNTVLMLTAYLFLTVHFFLALEAVAALAIAALVFLPPFNYGYFPYHTNKHFI